MTHISTIFREHKPSPKPKRPEPTTIACACGCGELIASHDDRGRPRRFAQDHAQRVQPTGWTEDQLDTLKSNWGMDCAELAQMLGKTKNAVIGKAGRIGLPSLVSNDGSRQRKSREEGRARTILRRNMTRETGERPANSNRGLKTAKRAKAHKPKRALKLAVDNSAVNKPKSVKVRRVARMHVDTGPSRNLHVGQLNRETCAYPTSSERGPTWSGWVHSFCGCAVEPGKTFCPGHMGVAFPSSTVIEKDIAA